MNKLLKDELLNLLFIHDNKEDDEPETWIRFLVSEKAYILLKTLASSAALQLHKSEENFLDEIISYLPHEVKVESAKEWFKPFSRMPVSVIVGILDIEREVLGKSEEEIENIAAEILPKMEYYYSSRNSKVSTRLPNKLSEDLIYLVGAIAGDGSLPRKRKKDRWEYPVVIEKANKTYIQDHYVPLFERIFNVKLRLTTSQKIGRKQTWRAEIGSKPIYRYLTKIFDHPLGDKAGRLRMPELVRSLSTFSQIPYFAGLIDTDFGSLGAGMGITTASPDLVGDLSCLLANIGVESRKYEYLKNEKFKMYQLVVPKKSVPHLVGVMTETYAFKNPKRNKFIVRG